MWQKEARAADQPIYGPDFQKELARARSFEQPFDPFDTLRAGKAIRQGVWAHFSFSIWHFSFLVSALFPSVILQCEMINAQ
jgi:hypothetical protein